MYIVPFRFWSGPSLCRKRIFHFFIKFLTFFSPQGIFSLVLPLSSQNAYCDFSSFSQDLDYVTIASFKNSKFCECEDLEVWGRAGSHHAQVTILVYGSRRFEVRFCLPYGFIVPPTRRVCHFINLVVSFLFFEDQFALRRHLLCGKMVVIFQR